MANIMVNESCNLRCPYCFAEEFVNKSPREMTLEDFKKALAFVLSDESVNQVGIIGGEPLLYTHINEALYAAIIDSKTEYVMIYTNAVELERLDPSILENGKFRMLVNCNSPADIGEKAFEKMVDNLLRFRDDHYGEGRFRLSVNIYKPDFDYSYIFPLLDSMYFDVIRLSISVPQKGNLVGKSPFRYFLEMKPITIRFIGDMIRRGVLTGFDCNFIPPCVFTDDEREGLLGAKDVLKSAFPNRYPQDFWDRTIFCEMNNCSPVVDVLPDLQAIRCFGLSEHSKENIYEFRDIDDLGVHYIYTIDRPAVEKWTEPECEECPYRKTGECSCGCLLFKLGMRS